MRRFEAAVVGLGAVGSAAALELASRGRRVLGLDRHAPPHDRGSTHGESRMIREAYFEGPQYVPLVRRAGERWRALERASGRPLLRRTGGLMIGPEDGALVEGSRRSAEAHDLPHEILSPAEVRARFPAFRVPRGAVALFEPRAGYLDPEACVRTQLELAAARGADLRTGVTVLGWEPDGDGVRIRTSDGSVAAERLLLAAGPWMPSLLDGLSLPLRLERTVQVWFRPRAAAGAPLEPDACPVYVFEREPETLWYGFPLRPRGVKAGFHHGTPVDDADAVGREVRAEEADAVRAALAEGLPDAAGPVAETSVCLYTLTPDTDFVIDRHPEHPAVVVASACSGHGFKFASVLAEVLADLLEDREPPFDLSPFRLDRFEPAS